MLNQSNETPQENGRITGTWTVERIMRFGDLNGKTIQEFAAILLERAEKHFLCEITACDRLSREYANRQRTFLIAMIEAERETLGKIIASHKQVNEVQLHKLIPSDVHGCYAFDRSDGRDLSAEDRLEVRVGEQWIRGTVKYAPIACVSQNGIAAGYFLECGKGDVIGLCTGMIVRLL